MNNQEEKSSLRLTNFKDLPVQYEKRNCTDVCCLVFGLLFSLIIIVTASVLFNKATFISVNYPTDSDGKLCGYDLPDYQYVYFSAAPLISTRVCVSKCPTKGDLSLSCHPNSVVGSCNFSPSNKYLDTLTEETRYGFFCWPVDQVLTNKLKEVSHILVREDFFKSLDAIKITLLASVVFSIVFLLLAHCLSTCLNYIIIPLSGITVLIAIILIFTFSTNETGVRTAIAIIFIIILAILILSIYKNSISIKIHAVFLKQASNLVSQHYSLVLYILLYLVCLVLFIALIIFQFVGFWSNGRKIFLPAQYLYYKLEGFSVSGLVSTILLVQLIWGVAFLKQSFNFCLSGTSILWYFQQTQKQNELCYPLKLHIFKHTGSIIACSFITSFFSLFDFIFDLIKPIGDTGCYASCYKVSCICLACIWDLVRSDAMTMVALAGNAFCNSARYCEYLCNKTPLTEYSQSVNRIYSLGSHFFIAALAVIFSVIFTSNSSIFALIIIIGGALTISTFFISLHADIAESIQVIYLMDQEFTDRMRREKEEKGISKHTIQGLGISTFHTDFAKQIETVFQTQNIANN